MYLVLRGRGQINIIFLPEHILLVNCCNSMKLSFPHNYHQQVTWKRTAVQNGQYVIVLIERKMYKIKAIFICTSFGCPAVYRHRNILYFSLSC